MAANSSSTFCNPVLRAAFCERRRLEQLLEADVEAARLLLEQPRPSSMLRAFSSAWMKCLILLRARDVTTKFSQSRLGLCPACRDDLDDVAVLERVRSGTILPLTRAPTHWCPTSVWMRVREVHRRGAARQRLDLALGA
jgi:hypothetical protein